jgi:hypothetical protein
MTDQHSGLIYDTQQLSITVSIVRIVYMLSATFLIVMLSVIMLSVVALTKEDTAKQYHNLF